MASWVASDQVRALSSGEAELDGIVDGSARGIFTKHMYEEMGGTINIVEARMDGYEGEFWKFSAQVMIAILVALVTWVLMDALRQKRQLEATALGKTVERGTQTEFNPVNQITVPTNVYCSPGGECFHTSRKCKGMQNVPMNAIWRRRSCTYCVQRDGR